VPPKPSLHHHCCCCAAITIAAQPLPLLHNHLLCHCCAHLCATIASLPQQIQETTTMETTMAMMINDDSDNEGNADDDGDSGDNHKGNDNEATTTRP
jgi:hypothetical protein